MHPHALCGELVAADVLGLHATSGHYQLLGLPNASCPTNSHRHPRTSSALLLRVYQDHTLVYYRATHLTLPSRGAHATVPKEKRAAKISRPFSRVRSKPRLSSGAPRDRKGTTSAGPCPWRS